MLRQYYIPFVNPLHIIMCSIVFMCALCMEVIVVRSLLFCIKHINTRILYLLRRQLSPFELHSRFHL